MYTINMQPTNLTEQTLYEFYEKVILPQFGCADDVTWDEHLNLGPDSDAYIFMHDGSRMALVFDDYPTTDAAQMGQEFPLSTITQVKRLSSGGVTEVDENKSTDGDPYVLNFGPSSVPYVYVHGITGYFQLFRIT